MTIYSDDNIRQIRAVYERFRQNRETFRHAVGLPLAAFIIAASLDCLSTIHFMLLNGIDQELHPHIWFISVHIGAIWGPIIGKLYQVCLGYVAAVYLVRHATIILWAGAASYTFAFLHNLGVTGFYAFILYG